MKVDEIEQEIVRCISSPYYFATKYMVVNVKPFETPLSEKAFNSYFKNRKSLRFVPLNKVDN